MMPPESVSELLTTAWIQGWLLSNSKSLGGESSNSPKNTARAMKSHSWRHPDANPTQSIPTTSKTGVLDLRQRLRAGAVVIAHVLRVRDELSIANNRVHEILQEHDHGSENPAKQGRKRPWVRFEREHAAVTVHMDWYQNDRGQQVLAVEDDASRRVLDMIETGSSSASQAVEFLESVDEEFDSPVPILEVITDHGSEFVNPRQDDRPCLDHEFERFLHDNDIEHTLCKVGRPQSNGKIERFFQTYEKHRKRFGTLDEFLTSTTRSART
jgi:putative transposase